MLHAVQGLLLLDRFSLHVLLLFCVVDAAVDYNATLKYRNVFYHFSKASAVAQHSKISSGRAASDEMRLEVKPIRQRGGRAKERILIGDYLLQQSDRRRQRVGATSLKCRSVDE